MPFRLLAGVHAVGFVAVPENTYPSWDFAAAVEHAPPPVEPKAPAQSVGLPDTLSAIGSQLPPVAVHEQLQVRVSVKPSYSDCCFGKSDGQVWLPFAITQAEMGGIGTQTRPPLQPAPATVVGQNLALLVQDAAESVAEPVLAQLYFGFFVKYMLFHDWVMA